MNERADLVIINMWAHRLELCETEHGALPPHGMYLAFTEWPMSFVPDGIVYGDLEDAKAKTQSFDLAEHAWLDANCPNAKVQYLACKRRRVLDLGTDFEKIPDFVAVRVIFTDDAQRERFFEVFPAYRPKAG